MKKIVVVGGGTASLGAIISAAARNAKIAVICKEPCFTYSRCALPYLISGEASSDIFAVDKPFLESTGTKFLLNSTALDVDWKKNELSYEKDGKHFTASFDSLILATGAAPVLPKIPGINASKTLFLRTLDDSEKILSLAKKGGSAVVVGAGVTGIELSCALAKLGVKVTLLEARKSILEESFDSEMASEIESVLKKNGVEVLTSVKIDEVSYSGKETIFHFNGRKLSSSLSVFCCGVSPETSFAKKIGLKISSSGFIETNEFLLTSRKSCFACGDCVLLPFDRKPHFLGTISYRMGLVAGENACGGKTAFGSVVRNMVSEAFGVEFASCGKKKIEVPNSISQTLRTQAMPSYWKKNESIILKLVCDSRGKLAGAQAIGFRAREHANFCAHLIASNEKISVILREDFSYCPANSKIPDPLATLADKILRKMELKASAGGARQESLEVGE